MDPGYVNPPFTEQLQRTSAGAAEVNHASPGLPRILGRQEPSRRITTGHHQRLRRLILETRAGAVARGNAVVRDLSGRRLLAGKRENSPADFGLPIAAGR